MLLEMLVGLMVFAVVLVVAADLLHRSRLVSNRVRSAVPADRLWSALVEISRALEGALAIDTPTPAANSNTLVFRRILPGAVRLPTTLGPTPAPVPADPWNPYQSGWVETVTISRDAQGQLLWGATVLMDHCESFECQPAPGRQLTLVGQVRARELQTVRVAHDVGPGMQW